MSNLKVFENQQFGEIRVVEKDGEPWFVAADVCRVLNIVNPTRSLANLKPYEKALHSMKEYGRDNEECNIVTESGLYKIIMRSRKKEAEEFQQWIAQDVLPSIRKFGVYATEDLLANPDFLIDALQALKKERVEKALLEQENSRLSAANDLMSIENRTWEERTIINTLVPSIAGIRAVSIPSVYKNLYREAMKKYHFNLPQRQQNWKRAHPEDKKHSALEFASEDEIHKLTVLCATEAYVMNVNMDKLLNEVNAKHAMELVELEERSETA